MTQQIINLGATGSGAGGDSARTAFEKAVANFAELYIAALPSTAAQKQAARDMFGLGTAATKAVQTYQIDTTTGALMGVGAFGLGRMLDLRNTVFEAGSPADVFGKGMVTGFARGGPDGLAIPAIPGSDVFGILTAYGHWVDAFGAAGAAWREFRTGGSLSRVFHQCQTGGAWSQWREVFNTANILGTVSQSSGVPTGAIIERGSNANGEYTRWADGTQICWLVVEETLAVIDAYGASRYGWRGWTFPAGFSAQPEIAASARTTANLLAAVPLDLPGYGSNTSCNWAFVDVAGASHTGPARMTFSAKGRWN